MKTLLAGSLLLLLSPAFAADKKAEKKAAPPQMDEATKKMIEYGTPGAEHARLKPVAGDWAVQSKSWMKPGDKAMESAGSSRFEWILDGRWLRQDFKGEMGGMPFTGVAHNGYDKVKGEYVGTWMDSMSTGMAVNHGGKYDAKTNTISDEGSWADPMSMEKEHWFRTAWTLPDGPDGKTMTFAMWTKDAKGVEFKTMEMLYTRK